MAFTSAPHLAAAARSLGTPTSTIVDGALLVVHVHIARDVKLATLCGIGSVCHTGFVTAMLL